MIAVSYLKSKYDKEKTINLINSSSASLIHVDLMDGLYVENKNFLIDEVINDLKNTTKLLDIHLMTKDPLKYIKKLINLNVWCFTIHLDSTDNVLDVIKYVKNKNIKIGIAINPDDEISLIDNYLDMIDYVLVMSVYPGKGGQKFMPKVLSKIKYLDKKNVLIGIDGGINKDTIKKLKNYKIDNIIVGSYICESNDYELAIKSLKDAL